MDANRLPDDLEACHRLIAELRSQHNEQALELSLKDKLIEEQAHSVLRLKADHDKLDSKVGELNLTIEKLLKQL